MNRFIQSTHQYFNGELEYLSVTKLIGKYQRPFNASMVAHMSAKYNKNKLDYSANDYLNIWDLKRDIAIDYGNSVHKAIELWVKYKIKPTQPHLQAMLKQFIKQFGKIKYESEVRIFNAEYELGGTVDLLSSKYLDDIKTNDTLKVDKKGNFTIPLNKVKVNNLNKARLQTSVYNTLLDKPRICRVLMWNGIDFEVIELEPIDVTEILELRKLEI